MREILANQNGEIFQMNDISHYFMPLFFKARFESADLIWEISSLGLLDIILSKKINFLERLH